MEQRRSAFYVQGHLFELAIFCGAPLAIAANEPVRPIFLAIVGFITAVYMVLGWLFQPLLQKRTPQSIAAWFSPIVLLAITGLVYEMGVLALGPFLVYVSTASIRNERRDTHSLLPVSLAGWGFSIIAITLAALVIILIVYASVICQWLIGSTFRWSGLFGAFTPN